MEDSPMDLDIDLIAHLRPPTSSAPAPASTPLSLTLNPPPFAKLEGQPKSPTPVNSAFDPDSAAGLLEPQAIAESPGSVTSAEDHLSKRARHLTIDSITSSSVDMDGSSTTATSPPPSGVEYLAKVYEKSNLFSSPDPQSSFGATAIALESELAPGTSTSSKRPTSSRTSTGLNKPKAEHMEYFLKSLSSGSSNLGVKQAAPRPRSPGRVPAAVQALEEAQKRSSQCSDKGSIRKSQDVRPLDVTSDPEPAENALQSVDAPPPGLGTPDNVSSAVPIPSPTPADETSSNRRESVKIHKSGIRLLLDRIRSNSLSQTNKQDPKLGINRQESGSTVETDSTPISIISMIRLKPALEPPIENGKDMRNDATYHRDLRTEFENRRFMGTHEHPVEGSMALHSPTGIKSMGLKRLVRSVSQAMKKTSQSFKKLVLRRAQTIPNQLSSTVLGNTATRKPIGRRILTRSQRVKAYTGICEGILPTFGSRVPTPPPYVPSARSSLELEPGNSFEALSSRKATKSPLKTPNYRQIGLFASQPHRIAAKLAGKTKAARNLTNGDAAPISPPNGENHSRNSQLPSPSSSLSVEVTPYDPADLPETQQDTCKNVVAQAPPSVKKGSIEKGFLNNTFKAW